MMSQPSVTSVEKRKIRQLMLKENKIKIRLAYKDARTLEKDGGGPLFALATTTGKNPVRTVTFRLSCIARKILVLMY